MGCAECKTCVYGSRYGAQSCPFQTSEDTCTGEPDKSKVVRVALVGSANVGKSVIFNQMTGRMQKIGNWAGKTVELARGLLNFNGQVFELVDLPGIYSLSGQTEDEAVTFEYLASGEVDIVFNILDSTALERNLYVTMQILEMNLPTVLALNKSDVARSKGIEIDADTLSGLLGVPVMKVVGITGQGLYDSMEIISRVACRKDAAIQKPPKYSAELEQRVETLVGMIGEPIDGYPPRFLALKLLEGHEASAKLVASKNPDILDTASKYQDELSNLQSNDNTETITSERYSAAGEIVRKTLRETPPLKVSMADRLDRITTHNIAGYLILALVMMSAFYTIFSLGNMVSGMIMQVYDAGGLHAQDLLGNGWAYTVLWDGMAQGLIAAVAFVLPFILPFYIFLALLEDSGYLARVAVLMDSTMHRVGLHGKAFIPLVLGYGCSVPAVLGTRILETKRERVIAGFLASLIPCAARTVVIMALVGVFLGWYWALGFYILNILIVFIIGRISSKLVLGEVHGLIMEVPRYHMPKPGMVLKQTWMRLRNFIVVALPILVFGSVLLVVMESTNAAGPVNLLFSPLTVWILGLPVAMGMILVLGVFRKELTMVMLFTLVNSQHFASVTDFLTNGQIIVFTLFVMFYIPCISTLAAMVKEYGTKITVKIAAAQVILAIFIAGGANLIFSLTGW